MHPNEAANYDYIRPTVKPNPGQMSDDARGFLGSVLFFIFLLIFA